MKIDFSHFSVAARNVVAIANEIKTLRGARGIDDIDLAVAISVVETQGLNELAKLDIGFSDLAKAIKINPLDITQKIGQTPVSVELQVPELDEYKNFTPSGRFVMHWLSNLACNTAIRNIQNNQDSYPLGDPTDLVVRPEHILFLALSNRTAAPSKLIEAAYHGVDLDPAKTLRERLGFKGCDITGSV